MRELLLCWLTTQLFYATAHRLSRLNLYTFSLVSLPLLLNFPPSCSLVNHLLLQLSPHCMQACIKGGRGSGMFDTLFWFVQQFLLFESFERVLSVAS